MNCALEACPPRCPLPGHNWQSVCHKDETTWLAYYRDTINGEFKYIFLSAGSSLKGQSDRCRRPPKSWILYLFLC